MILNRIKHTEFKPFLTSKKGQQYFKGVWADPKAGGKAAAATVDKFFGDRAASQAESQVAVYIEEGTAEHKEAPS